MNRWPPLALEMLALIAALFMTVSCNKDKGDTSASTAAAGASSPTVFTPHSRLVVEGVPVELTPTIAPRAQETEGEAENGPVDVSIDADPTSGGVPLTVQFTAEVSGGPPGVMYTWNFGDHSAPAHQLNVQHTYSSVGEYTATFTVTGQDVNETNDVDIEVTEEGFDADINADPDIGTAPLTVEFSAVVDEDVQQPLSFQWDFGDGARDVSNPTRHTYRVAGQYTVTLTVTNGGGQSAHHDVEIQVDPAAAEQEE